MGEVLPPTPRIENFVVLPLDVVELMTDPSYLFKIEKSDYLTSLLEDIAVNGILRPGIITLGPSSASLSDGNHRFLCAKMLGLKEYPATIRVAEKSGSVRGGSYKSIMPIILERARWTS